MAKARNTAFFCKECGYESAKWLGQCPVCKEWNTFVEEPVAQTKKAPAGQINAVGAGKTAVPVHISEISLEEQDRTPTGFGELDRVLGSGIVKGSLVLVGGDPGIGKSTLLLQVCRNLAGAGKRVLYISGEESLKQIKMRANRIGEISGDLLLLCETNLDTIHSAIERAKPQIVVIIDSIQTMFTGRYLVGTWKREPGPGVDKSPDADRKGIRDHDLYRRPCDKRRALWRDRVCWNIWWIRFSTLRETGMTAYRILSGSKEPFRVHERDRCV